MASPVKRLQDAVKWRSRLAASNVRNFFELLSKKRIKLPPVDPEVTYPCYKSFDNHIDVEKLRSLNDSLVEKIEKYLSNGNIERFETGPFKLKAFSRTRPGSREIPLSVSNRDSYAYYSLDKPECWEPSKHVNEFPELMAFIDTLPFKGTGRMMIICDNIGRAVTPHQDHVNAAVNHEFIWFRTNLDKPFYMQDVAGKKREYVKSYSAWFDTVNQFHGGDETGKLAFSIRVDGIFTDEFRAQIPVPKRNPASTSALWASLSS